MSRKQWAVVVIGTLAAVWHSAGSAQAGGVFGTEEVIRTIGPTADPQYELGYKARTFCFVLGCYVKDDGYVLRPVGSKDRYIPLDEATIRKLQDEKLLPTPLPAYSLRFWQYLLGYSNWIVLGLIGVAELVRRGRRWKLPPAEAETPQPASEDGHSPVTASAFRHGHASSPVDRPAPFDAADAAPGETYRKTCPACGSHDVRTAQPAHENDNVFNFSNFRVYHDRRCLACGRTWTPPCPRRAAYRCVAAGTALMCGVGAIVLVFVREDGAQAGLIGGLVVSVLPAVAGVFSLLYGVGVLTGRLGMLRMR